MESKYLGVYPWYILRLIAIGTKYKRGAAAWWTFRSLCPDAASLSARRGYPDGRAKARVDIRTKER